MGAVRQTESVLGELTFELRQNGNCQVFRKHHVERIDGRNLDEVKFCCKINLLRVGFPELVSELKEHVCRRVFFPQGAKKSETLAKDFSVE